MQWLREMWTRLREMWTTLFQVATWLVGMVTPFVIEPPFWSGLDVSAGAGAAAFTVAVLLGLGLVALRRWGTSSSLGTWMASIVLALVAGVLALFAYLDYSSQWTAPYAGRRVIIGATLTADAREYQEEQVAEVGHPLSNENLILHYGGDLGRIWPVHEINKHGLVVFATYFVCIVLLALSAGAVAQLIAVRRDRERRGMVKMKRRVCELAFVALGLTLGSPAAAQPHAEAPPDPNHPTDSIVLREHTTMTRRLGVQHQLSIARRGGSRSAPAQGVVISREELADIQRRAGATQLRHLVRFVVAHEIGIPSATRSGEATTLSDTARCRC